MADTTTVKVSMQVRNRINANAKRQGKLTADAYLNILLDRDEWRDRLRAAGQDMRSASEDEDFQAEVQSWDALNLDLDSP